MGAKPNNILLVKNVLKEKEIEIQILKKKLKIPEGHHVQTPELVSIQTERDGFYRDVVKFKEQVIEFQNYIEQYKDKMNLVEKENIELEDFKDPVTYVQSKLVQDEKDSEDLVKAMASLKLKDEEIEKLKANLVQKDTHITILKEIVTKKGSVVKEAQDSKNQMKERLSKYNN